MTHDPDAVLLRWVAAAVVIILAVIGLGLAVLHLDAEQGAATEQGRTIAPHRVGRTPTTYGPPPA